MSSYSNTTQYWIDLLNKELDDDGGFSFDDASSSSEDDSRWLWASFNHKLRLVEEVISLISVFFCFFILIYFFLFY